MGLNVKHDLKFNALYPKQPQTATIPTSSPKESYLPRENARIGDVYGDFRYCSFFG